MSTGYLCSRCERYEILLFRVLSVEQVELNEIVIKHTCICIDPSVVLKGRYVLVPDLMYRLFRNRVVRLPYHVDERPGFRHVGVRHPDVVAFREELEGVNTLDDLFPPG